MSAIYVLDENNKVMSVINGDEEVLSLNIPADHSFTFIEPEDYFRQVFDLDTQRWIYPDD